MIRDFKASNGNNCPVEKVLTLLEQTSSGNEWRSHLEEFIIKFDSVDRKSSVIPYSGELVIILLNKLDYELNDSPVPDSAVLLLALDALRITFRERDQLSRGVASQLMKHFVNVAFDPAFDVALSHAAIRCLINILFQNERNVELFCNPDIDGLCRIAVTLTDLAITEVDGKSLEETTKRHLNFHFYIVRLLFMMIAQGDHLKAVLRPARPITLQLVSALILRLGACCHLPVSYMLHRQLQWQQQEHYQQLHPMQQYHAYEHASTACSSAAHSQRSSFDCKAELSQSEREIHSQQPQLLQDNLKETGAHWERFPYLEENAALYNEVCKLLLAIDVYEVTERLRMGEERHAGNNSCSKEDGDDDGNIDAKFGLSGSSILRSSTEDATGRAALLGQSSDDNGTVVAAVAGNRQSVQLYAQLSDAILESFLPTRLALKIACEDRKAAESSSSIMHSVDIAAEPKESKATADTDPIASSPAGANSGCSGTCSSRINSFTNSIENDLPEPLMQHNRQAKVEKEEKEEEEKIRTALLECESFALQLAMDAPPDLLNLIATGKGNGIGYNSVLMTKRSRSAEDILCAKASSATEPRPSISDSSRELKVAGEEGVVVATVHSNRSAHSSRNSSPIAAATNAAAKSEPELRAAVSTAPSVGISNSRSRSRSKYNMSSSSSGKSGVGPSSQMLPPRAPPKSSAPMNSALRTTAIATSAPPPTGGSSSLAPATPVASVLGGSVPLLSHTNPPQQQQQQHLVQLVSALEQLLWRLLRTSETLTRIDEKAATLVPILVFMTKLATHHMPARAELKRVVFPTAHWEPAPSGSKGVDPRDAPRGTLRGELAHLMISLDSNVKRCAAEFLYVLCNEDGDEFVARTGFGHAVALLQIKGLC